MTGSPTIVRELLRAGLIDEIRLFVAPVVRGHGARLFDQGWNAGLTLRESRPLPHGLLRLIYETASA